VTNIFDAGTPPAVLPFSSSICLTAFPPNLLLNLHAAPCRGVLRSLFGDDVGLLLDMDRANSPNSIQLSEAALALVSGQQCSQFTPACSVACEGRSMQMYSWAPEVRGADGVFRPVGAVWAAHARSTGSTNSIQRAQAARFTLAQSVSPPICC
jgi:hypothetical protein